MKFFYTILIFTFLHIVSFAQTTGSNLTDSIAIRINQISTLQKSGELERAQLEVEDLKWFVRRERSYFPAKSLATILSVYEANHDAVSAAKFLDEATSGISGIKDATTRAEITTELIKLHELRGNTAKALALQKSLTTDSAFLASKSISSRMDSIKRASDSLAVIRQLEVEDRDHYVQMDRNRALTLGAVGLLSFLALLAAHFMQKAKYKEQIDQLETENEVLKGELYATQHQLPLTKETNDPDPVIPPPLVITKSAERPTHIPSLPSGAGQQYKPKFLALLVEPNRQIAMYLKSLLGSEFEVETTETFAEALTIANEQIPDIVICDAILNGMTGIDLSRQLKQGAKTNHIPLILVSSKTGVAAQEEKLRADADLVIARPILDEDLDEQVRGLFKQRANAQTTIDHVLQLWFSDKKPQLDDPFLRDMFNIIERYIPEANFSSVELARLMQYDKHVFNRKVLALAGREPQDIIKILRLEKAKFLLEHRAAPVQVIAGLVGFDNQGAFVRAFKEHFGDTTMLLLN